MSTPSKRSGVTAWLAGITCSPEQALVGLILIFLVLHLILAATLGLVVDETYGIGVSYDLNLSYFDHPPLHYWIAHFFMPLLGNGRALRLPFIAIFVGTTWVLYLLTRQLFGSAAGLWAVVALNLSAFFTLAGGFIMPDGPLMFCLVAAAYTISRALFPEGEPPSPWRIWIVVGLWIGLAGLSKYHAALFVVGLIVYFVSMPTRRHILYHPAPWVGAAIALIIITPVIIWNAQHHWVSFAFQGGRAGGLGNFPKLKQFLGNLGGQILYLAPWIFIPMVVAAYQALRLGRAADRSWYCLCLGVPTITLFTVVSLWGQHRLPHWQMPGWLLLYPVLGDYLAREAQIRRRPYTWAITSAVVTVVVAFLLVGHAATGYGRLLFPRAFARRDATLDAFEWTPLRAELQTRGLLKEGNLFIISKSPRDMGDIDQALNDAMPMQKRSLAAMP
jgi:4-amino-4-deoxy-L-arabinose transferase-like glycosyltransferase